jgi:hypothetical protein
MNTAIPNRFADLKIALSVRFLALTLRPIPVDGAILFLTNSNLHQETQEINSPKLSRSREVSLKS